MHFADFDSECRYLEQPLVADSGPANKPAHATGRTVLMFSSGRPRGVVRPEQGYLTPTVSRFRKATLPS